MRTWEEVQAMPQYQSLSPAEKDEAAMAYSLKYGGNVNDYATPNTARSQIDEREYANVYGGEEGADPRLADGIISSDEATLMDQVGAGWEGIKANTNVLAADVLQRVGHPKASAYHSSLAEKQAQQAAQVEAPQARDTEGVWDFVTNYVPQTIARQGPQYGVQIGLGALPYVGVPLSTAFGAAQATGSILAEQKERGIDDPAMAYGTGAAIGLLGTAGGKLGGLLPKGVRPSSLVAQQAAPKATGIISAVSNAGKAGIRAGVAEMPIEGIEEGMAAYAGGERDREKIGWRMFEGSVAGFVGGGFAGAGKKGFEEANHLYLGLGEPGEKIGGVFSALRGSGIEINGDKTGKARMAGDKLQAGVQYLRDNNIARNSDEYLQTLNDIQENSEGFQAAAYGEVMDRLQKGGVTFSRDMLDPESRKFIDFNEGLIYKAANLAEKTLTPNFALKNLKENLVTVENEYSTIRGSVNNMVANFDEQISIISGHLTTAEKAQAMAKSPAEKLKAEREAAHYKKLKESLKADRVTAKGIFTGIKDNAPDASSAQLRRARELDLAAGTNLAEQLQQAAILKGFANNLQQTIQTRDNSTMSRYAVGGAITAATGASAVLPLAGIGWAGGKVKRGIERRAMRRAKFDKLGTKGSGINFNPVTDLDTSYKVASQMDRIGKEVEEEVASQQFRKEHGDLTPEQYEAQQQGKTAAREAAITKGKDDLQKNMDGFTNIDDATIDKAMQAELLLQDMQDAHDAGDAELFKGLKREFDSKLLEVRSARLKHDREQGAQKKTDNEADRQTKADQRDARAAGIVSDKIRDSKQFWQTELDTRAKYMPEESAPIIQEMIDNLESAKTAGEVSSMERLIKQAMANAEKNAKDKVQEMLDTQRRNMAKYAQQAKEAEDTAKAETATAEHEASVDRGAELLEGLLSGAGDLDSNTRNDIQDAIDSLYSVEEGDKAGLKHRITMAKQKITQAIKARNDALSEKAKKARKDADEAKKNAKTEAEKKAADEKEKKARDAERDAEINFATKVRYEQQQLSLDLELSGITNQTDIDYLTTQIQDLSQVRNATALQAEAKLIRSLLNHKKRQAKSEEGEGPDTDPFVDVDIDVDTDTDTDVETDVETEEAPLTTETPLNPNKPTTEAEAEPAANVNPMANTPPVQPEVDMSEDIDLSDLDTPADVDMSGDIDLSALDVEPEVDMSDDIDLSALDTQTEPQAQTDVDQDAAQEIEQDTDEDQDINANFDPEIDKARMKVALDLSKKLDSAGIPAGKKAKIRDAIENLNIDFDAVADNQAAFDIEVAKIEADIEANRTKREGKGKAKGKGKGKAQETAAPKQEDAPKTTETPLNPVRPEAPVNTGTEVTPEVDTSPVETEVEAETAPEVDVEAVNAYRNQASDALRKRVRETSELTPEQKRDLESSIDYMSMDKTKEEIDAKVERINGDIDTLVTLAKDRDTRATKPETKETGKDQSDSESKVKNDQVKTRAKQRTVGQQKLDAHKDKVQEELTKLINALPDSPEKDQLLQDAVSTTKSKRSAGSVDKAADAIKKRIEALKPKQETETPVETAPVVDETVVETENPVIQETEVASEVAPIQGTEVDTAEVVPEVAPEVAPVQEGSNAPLPLNPTTVSEAPQGRTAYPTTKKALGPKPPADVVKAWDTVNPLYKDMDGQLKNARGNLRKAIINEKEVDGFVTEERARLKGVMDANANNLNEEGIPVIKEAIVEFRRSIAEKIINQPAIADNLPEETRQSFIDAFATEDSGTKRNTMLKDLLDSVNLSGSSAKGSTPTAKTPRPAASKKAEKASTIAAKTGVAPGKKKAPKPAENTSNTEAPSDLTVEGVRKDIITRFNEVYPDTYDELSKAAKVELGNRIRTLVSDQESKLSAKEYEDILTGIINDIENYDLEN